MRDKNKRKMKKIIVNTRTGCIHNKNCENVSQIREENKAVKYVYNFDNIDKMYLCQHCMKKDLLLKIENAEYKNKMKRLEERKKRDLRRLEARFKHREEKTNYLHHREIDRIESFYYLENV